MIKKETKIAFEETATALNNLINVLAKLEYDETTSIVDMTGCLPFEFTQVIIFCRDSANKVATLEDTQ